jgi:transposase InsO family protein
VIGSPLFLYSPYEPYYGKKEPYVISDNHLNRGFHASKPNEKWVTDITYLIFNGQKLYLSVIKARMKLWPTKLVREMSSNW